MNNQSTRVDAIPTSLWQKALDLSASAILVYELVKQKGDQAAQFLIQLANRQAEQMVGFTRDELIGRFAHDLFPKTINHHIWSQIELAAQTGKALRAEFFCPVGRTGDTAAWFDVSIEPTHDKQSVVVSYNDISAWKQTQLNLLSDSILFKALSSTVPEMGVIAIDFFQKIALANGSLPGLFSSTNAADLVGRRFLDTIEPASVSDWQRYLATAFDGEQHHFTTQWDGSRSEVFVGPVRNAGNQVVMGLVVFKNVSEQYQQQQALQQANTSLHRSNKSLERFAYVASHDLQEPLRKIRSFGDVLNAKYSPRLDDMGRDMIDRMQSAAGRMDELIRSLLTFSRINTPVLTPELVSLDELFVGIQIDLEMMVSDTNAIITVQPALPAVPGDETQLRQLFQNLLTNALKFTAPNVSPRVQVTARVVDGNEVPMNSDPGRNPHLHYAEISVSDNGIGIEEENFDAIFGLFTRLHSRTTYAGTGIGLATTKRVAENHGGTVAVESELGRGTTFKVYLPLDNLQ